MVDSGDIECAETVMILVTFWKVPGRVRRP